MEAPLTFGRGSRNGVKLEGYVFALLWLSVGIEVSVKGVPKVRGFYALLELRESLHQRRDEPSPKPCLVREAVLALEKRDFALERVKDELCSAA